MSPLYPGQLGFGTGHLPQPSLFIPFATGLSISYWNLSFPTNFCYHPQSTPGYLQKVMKGIDMDEKAFINVFTKNLNIANEFKAIYGKNLISDIKSELSGKFENLVIALLIPLPELLTCECIMRWKEPVSMSVLRSKFCAARRMYKLTQSRMPMVDVNPII